MEENSINADPPATSRLLKRASLRCLVRQGRGLGGGAGDDAGPMTSEEVSRGHVGSWGKGFMATVGARPRKKEDLLQTSPLIDLSMFPRIKVVARDERDGEDQMSGIRFLWDRSDPFPSLVVAIFIPFLLCPSVSFILHPS